MHYEAIIQVAQIQDEDLLYLNFSNAAVGMGASQAHHSPPCPPSPPLLMLCSTLSDCKDACRQLWHLNTHCSDD